MEKAKLLKLYLLALLLMVFMVAPIHADVNLRENYLRAHISHGVSPERNYYEFMLGVREEDGIDDILRDIHIKILFYDSSAPGGSREVELAYLPLEDTSMDRMNTEYGAIQWIGRHLDNEDETMQYAYFRYYPSTRVIDVLHDLAVDAWWDIDRKGIDKKKDGTDVHWELGLAPNYNNYHVPNVVESVEYRRNKDKTVGVHAKFLKGDMEVPGWERRLHFHDNDGVSDPPSIGSFVVKNSDTELNGVFDRKYELTIGSKSRVFMTYHKTETVEPGILDSRGRSVAVDVEQMFRPVNQDINNYPIPSCAPPERIYAGYGSSHLFREIIDYDYYGTETVIPRLYRRLASEPASARKLIAEAKPCVPSGNDRTNYFKISMENGEMDFGMEYVYDITLYPYYWAENENVPELTGSLNYRTETLTELFNRGDGTKESPYEIIRKDDVLALSEYVAMNFPTKGLHWKQMNDIHMNNEPLNPIGSSNLAPFRGNYDGGAHFLFNLNVEDPKLRTSGLFGFVSGKGLAESEWPVLENIGIKESKVAGKQGVGFVAGELRNATVRCCMVEGDISLPAQKYVGGIVGFAENAKINDCMFTGSVNGKQYVGGLVGALTYSTAARCLINATVNGTSDFGAVSGSYFGGEVSNCYYDNTKSTDIQAVGCEDLWGTNLFYQLGIENWKFDVNAFPILKPYDNNYYTSDYDLVLDAFMPLQDIDGEVPNVDVVYDLYGSNYRSTIMLPFPVSKEQMSPDLKIYAYKGCYSEEGLSIAFFQEVTEMEANTPYLRGRVGPHTPMFYVYYYGVTVVPTNNMPDVTAVPQKPGLYGSYKRVDNLPDGAMLFDDYAETSNNLGGFYYPAAGDYLPAMEAYLWDPNIPKDTKIVEIMLFDPTSSVPEIIAELENGDKSIYNLKGQRLSMPQDGINIINGKKVIKCR